MSELKSSCYYYELGQRDCRTGLSAKDRMPESYYSGFSEQYHLEQQQSQRGFN